jgi:hypothetical protein
VEVSNVGKELTDAVLGGPEPGNQRVFEVPVMVAICWMAFARSDVSCS